MHDRHTSTMVCILEMQTRVVEDNETGVDEDVFVESFIDHEGYEAKF